MSERNKRIVAVSLIIGGSLLVGYNFLRSSEPKVHGRQVEQVIHLDSLSTLEVSEPIQEQKADILALFVLKSDVCPPCVNNTIKYIDLLDKKDINVATSALFVETEPEKVHRFVNITELPIPYRITTKKLIPEPLKNSLQQLVFVNPSRETIFYRLTIPGNVTTTPKYKKKILAQAFETWDDMD